MPTDRKTIKHYDDHAKRWSDNMRSGRNLAHLYVEKPAMYKKLPSLRGNKVLCVGCGSGEECADLLKKGAKEVVGIDLSEGLLEIARKSYPDVTFKQMDMEKLKFPKDSFDLVYSSLTIHYVADWVGALKQMRRVLKPGGRALVSAQHPTYFGADQYWKGKTKYNLLGYEKDERTGRFKSYGDALTVRKIEKQHYGMPMITYMKPIAGMVQDILASGFTIEDCIEPLPTKQAFHKVKPWAEINSRIPLFIIWELRG